MALIKKQWVVNTITIILLIILIISCYYLWKVGEHRAPLVDNNNRFKVFYPEKDFFSLALSGNTLWAGGVDGVYTIDTNTMESSIMFSKDSSLSFVRAVVCDKKGNVWFGHDKGLSYYNGKEIKHIKVSDNRQENTILALTEDSQGLIWAGTWGGALIFENGILKHKWTKAHGLLDDMVNVIFKDSYGGMWFGSYTAPKGGVSYFSKGTWQYFSIENGLIHNNVNAIFEDNSGDIWIGTGFHNRGAAQRFKNNAGAFKVEQTLSKENGLAGEKVRSLFEDTPGRIWIGSEYDGIAVLSNNKVTVLTKADGLSDNEVKYMLMDNDGKLWFATCRGITVINQKNLSEIFSGD